MGAPSGRTAGPARGLVLGGGGVAGIAWEIGVLRGLQESGIAVVRWDVVVGTSAGSIVAARVLTDPDLERWHAYESRAISTAEDELVALIGGRTGRAAVRLSRRSALRWVAPAWLTWLTMEAVVRRQARPSPLRAEPLGPGIRRIAPPNRTLARLGALARAARTPAESTFLRVVEEVLAPAVDWPANLLVTAVDTTDGTAVAFDARSGVPLVRAVAASSSVPVIFPPTRALGRSWMDGGMASTTHAPLAVDADEILVIAPLRSRALDAEANALRSIGRRVGVITPGPAAGRIMGFGVGLLDPVRRPAAAEAGRADGLAAASRLAGEPPRPGEAAPAA